MTACTGPLSRLCRGPLRRWQHGLGSATARVDGARGAGDCPCRAGGRAGPLAPPVGAAGMRSPGLAPPGGRGYTHGMRVLIQRVSRAVVRVDDRDVAAIGRGLLVLVGVTHEDGQAAARKLAAKTVKLRVFEDEAGLMNLALADVGGEVLAVPQFTLYADARKGNRPSFTDAAPPRAGRGALRGLRA